MSLNSLTLLPRKSGALLERGPALWGLASGTERVAEAVLPESAARPGDKVSPCCLLRAGLTGGGLTSHPHEGRGDRTVEKDRCWEAWGDWTPGALLLGM